MSSALNMEWRPVVDAEQAWAGLWEIKKARALDDLLPDPCDLDAEFAAFATEASEWASLTFEAAAETWPQD